ncbi:hypothetical protein KBI23_04225 [bacterium]|nr:hypothetical protein [bacterium]MBP9807311.1 hypothetical protein [bacterium]
MKAKSSDVYNARTSARGDRLAILGLMLLAATVPLHAASATDLTSQVLGAQAYSPRQKTDSSSAKPQLIAQSQGSSEEQKDLEAYSRSKYTYIDAKLLAKMWNKEVSDVKTHIGFKLLSGPLASAELEQNLVDARIKALASVNSNQGLTYWQDSGHTYDDAVALAKLWGESSPWNAKVRVEKNLILGNEEVIKKSVILARK